MLRGVYFTSGTQAGTPIDRLLASCSAASGCASAPTRAPDGNRSFFLTRLLREVVFAEAPLVRRASRMERRERRLAALAGARPDSAILLVLGGWPGAISAADRCGPRLRRIAMQSLPRRAGRDPPDSGSAGDVREALPTLQAAEALADTGVSGPFGLGLSQSGRLRAFGEETYRRALDRVFLPYLCRGSRPDCGPAEPPEAAAETLEGLSRPGRTGRAAGAAW